MPLTWIIPLLLLAFFAALVIVMIIVSWRGYRGCCGIMGDHACDGDHERSQDAMKTRHVKGEISKDDPEQLKQDLKE